MDKLDIRLLNILQSNNRLTAEQLSERVPLSPSAIMRRLHKLREAGAIAADVSLLGPQVRQGRLEAILQVQLDRHSPRGYDGLRRHLLRTEEIQFYLEISGAYDLLLLGTWRDMTAFNDFVDAALASNPVVRRYETSFVKRQLRASPAIPLDEADYG